jgi:hypothetical protein
MTRAPFIVIDGKLYRWELRRAQLAAARRPPPALRAHGIGALSATVLVRKSGRSNNGEPPMSDARTRAATRASSQSRSSLRRELRSPSIGSAATLPVRPKARPTTRAYSPAIFCWPWMASPLPAPMISCACSTQKRSIVRSRSTSCAVRTGAVSGPPCAKENRFRYLAALPPVTGADDLVRLLDAEKINCTIPLDALRRSDQRRFWAVLRERK